MGCLRSKSRAHRQSGVYFIGFVKVEFIMRFQIFDYIYLPGGMSYYITGEICLRIGVAKKGENTFWKC